MTHVELHQKGKRLEAILNDKPWIRVFDTIEEANEEYEKLQKWLLSIGKECTKEHEPGN